MSNTQDFIREEKESFGKIFVDISYAIDNVSPFLEKGEMQKRKYVVKLPVLKKYIELLDAASAEDKKEGFFKMFKGDKYTHLLEGYKRDNSTCLNQLEKCSKCACLNCTANCNFDSCLGCRQGSRIAKCDHENMNATLHDNYTLELTNDNTGEEDSYTVLATMQNCELDRKYIIIENKIDREKFILYYYPGISEDDYGEIEDAEEFDFIAETYEGLEY